MTANRYLIDTNILIYAYDSFDQKKQKIAEGILRESNDGAEQYLSTQILAECGSVLIKRNFTRKEAREIVEQYAQRHQTLLVEKSTVLLALQLFEKYFQEKQKIIWDAVLLATAVQHGINAIITEDIQSAPVLEGVKYLNPFAAA
jgi:predicted nucleic acid-binding protein